MSRRYNVHLHFAGGLEHTLVSADEWTVSYIKFAMDRGATSKTPFLTLRDGSGVVYVNSALLGIVEFVPIEGGHR